MVVCTRWVICSAWMGSWAEATSPASGASRSSSRTSPSRRFRTPSTIATRSPREMAFHALMQTMSWNTRGCVRGTAPAGQGDLEVVAVAFQQRLVGGHRRVERDVEQPHVSVFGLDLERSDREAVGLQAKR